MSKKKKKTKKNKSKSLNQDKHKIKSFKAQETKFNSKNETKYFSLINIIKSLETISTYPKKLSASEFEYKVSNRSKKLIFSLPQQFYIETVSSISELNNITPISYQIFITPDRRRSIIFILGNGLEKVSYSLKHLNLHTIDNNLLNNKSATVFHLEKDLVINRFTDFVVAQGEQTFLIRVDPIKDVYLSHNGKKNANSKVYQSYKEIFDQFPQIESNSHWNSDIVSKIKTHFPKLINEADLNIEDSIFVGKYLEYYIYQCGNSISCYKQDLEELLWTHEFDMKVLSSVSHRYVISVREEYIYAIHIPDGVIALNDELSNSFSWVYHPAVTVFGMHYLIDCESLIWNIGFNGEHKRGIIKEHDSYHKDITKYENLFQPKKKANLLNQILSIFSSKSYPERQESQPNILTSLNDETGFYSELQINFLEGGARDIKGVSDGFTVISTLNKKLTIFHKVENLLFQQLGKLCASLEDCDLETFIDFKYSYIHTEYLSLALLRSKAYFEHSRLYPFYSSIILVHKPTLAHRSIQHGGMNNLYVEMLDSIYLGLESIFKDSLFDDIMFGTEYLSHFNILNIKKLIDKIKLRANNKLIDKLGSLIHNLEFFDEKEVEQTLASIIAMKVCTHFINALVYMISYLKLSANDNYHSYMHLLIYSLPKNSDGGVTEEAAEELIEATQTIAEEHLEEPATERFEALLATIDDVGEELVKETAVEETKEVLANIEDVRRELGLEEAEDFEVSVEDVNDELEAVTSMVETNAYTEDITEVTNDDETNIEKTLWTLLSEVLERPCSCRTYDAVDAQRCSAHWHHFPVYRHGKAQREMIAQSAKLGLNKLQLQFKSNRLMKQLKNLIGSTGYNTKKINAMTLEITVPNQINKIQAEQLKTWINKARRGGNAPKDIELKTDFVISSTEQNLIQNSSITSTRDTNTERNNDVVTSTVKGVKFNMISCPAGEFWMGSKKIYDSYIEHPHHLVKITKPFLIGQTQVTQALWEIVMGSNPSRFKGKKLPVEYITWYNMAEFCNTLSELQGFQSAYKNLSSGKILDIRLDRLANGYRMPTEKEWEYAAKANTEYTYAGSNTLRKVGWSYKDSNNRTHPVASKKPNAWGLYDMSGNVAEWCDDKWIPAEPTFNLSRMKRAIRGGSWDNEAVDCRITSRAWLEINCIWECLGGRLLRTNIGDKP